MSGKYDDILHLPRPEPRRHLRMSASDRAAQFSPFAALTGFDRTISEAGRLTDAQVELQEDARTLLDQKQQLLLELSQKTPELTVTYFTPDSRKDGGSYPVKSGFLKEIDPVKRVLCLTDGTRIPLDSIVDLDSPHLQTLWD